MDELNNNKSLGLDVYDDKLVNKTGLGCGCDITQNIANGNCKTQILDFEKLKENGGVEIDTKSECISADITGEDYSKMTDKINSKFVGKIGASFLSMAFGGNLNTSLNGTIDQLDIYEYGMSMILNKTYSLNIAPSLLPDLRDFVSFKARNEINATFEKNRTDKNEIKTIFKNYGTHITTKAFYGCLYQYFMYRERNEWESNMETQLKIGSNYKLPIPETDIKIDGKENADFSYEDKECFKHSKKRIVERKIGGNTSLTEKNEWLKSCDLENPTSNAFLGYSFNSGSNGDSGLIPIYELLDKSDERYNAMKVALDEYIQENSIVLKKRKMVIVDAYAKHYRNGKAPAYCYGIDGDFNNNEKYFRLEENVFDHVKGCTEGSFYFYYALGHLTDNAIVDMKFAHKDDIDGDWKIRGDKANDGVTGSLKNRHLAVRVKNINNSVSENEFVSGFGINVDGKVKAISKGTTTDFNWKENKDSEEWYKGLVHDDVNCIYTKDELNDF